MTRVLIAGCGYVGTALGVRLAREGAHVWGLRRSTEGLPSEITPVEADLCDRRSLDALPVGIDRLVYAASPDASDAASYEAAYVRGQETLLDALAKRGETVQRLVLISTTGVHAQRDGSWIDERSVTEPSDPGARHALAGEAIARASGIPAIVIRFSGIYGPGRTRLLSQVRDGSARLPAESPWYTNRIHRDDCAGAIAHLLALPDPADLYLGTDHEPADLAEVMRFLARELGVAPPEAAAEHDEVAARPPTHRRRTQKRCKNDRLVASGYRFQHPTYREGYRALIAAMR
jgi:nucleoside-diphosphate-sugar epimerase